MQMCQLFLFITTPLRAFFMLTAVAKVKNKSRAMEPFCEKRPFLKNKNDLEYHTKNRFSMISIQSKTVFGRQRQ